MGAGKLSESISSLRKAISPQLRIIVDRYHESRDESVRRELEESYLRLIDRVLVIITSWQQYRFYYLGTTQEDLMQWARIAAVESIKRFDPSRGTDFFAYLISFVRRYVYNKILDELPVPRVVSKRIRSYTARGVSITGLPSPLYNAAMLRCPVTAEKEVLEQYTGPVDTVCSETEDEETQQSLLALIDFIGEEQWEFLCECLDRLPSSKRRISALINKIARLETPPDLQPLMNNLIEYLRRQIC